MNVAQLKTKIAQRFDGVAGRYDLMTALSPGYKKQLRQSARRLAAPDNARLLDLCCGTGISTLALADEYPNAKIDALDASEQMLVHAKQKSRLGHVNFHHGDAMDPAAALLTGPYDAILMAYGIRNVVNPDLCLKRLLALLKPGGKLCLHEFSVNDSARSKAVWHAVNLGVIMPLGAVLAPGSDIYRYLWRSVLDFDGVRELEGRMRSMGFANVRSESMVGWQHGIIHSFLGERPETVN